MLASEKELKEFAIELTQGKKALVCSCHYRQANAHKWYFSSGYAKRGTWDGKNKKRTGIYMHNEINQTPRGRTTDHINDNKLDNRCFNLRTATYSQNITNRKARPNRFGYRGVAANTRGYQAKVCKDRKWLCLGTYSTAKEAAYIYDQAALQLFGEFARLNYA